MSRSYRKFYRSIFQAGSKVRKFDFFRKNPVGNAIKQQAITGNTGTILIVDISGYSQFVKQSDNSIGAKVISGLLASIISNNILDFQISEIEGDAILFYQYGPSQPVELVLVQFEQMLVAFNQQILQIKPTCPQATILSIKMVTHYGMISEFTVDRFRKIYGQAVVEAHRLLKNHIHSHTYALVTQEYFLQTQGKNVEQFRGGSQLCEIYDVGELCYTYFPYDRIDNWYTVLRYK